MAQPRKNISGDAPADSAQGASRVFARRPAIPREALTSDSIAADMDAFRRAGGTIEVLGTTRVLRKVGATGA